MKNFKLFFVSALLILLTSVVLLFPSSKYKNELKNIREKDFILNQQSDIKNYSTINENKDVKTISCKGTEFAIYPSLEFIKNKDLLEFLQNLNMYITIKNDFRIPNPPIKKDIYDFLSSESIGKFQTYGYKDFQTRIDGEKLEWSPVTLLPTNGKFIMMVLANWEKEMEEPPSSGFYLCTFSLDGKMQSIKYIYGHEEFYRNELNTDTLTSIWGRVYCLNTNHPVVRKAVLWDEYDNRGGFLGGSLEIREIQYSINNEGIIHTQDEKVIFPKKHVRWKERERISFYEESDTIRKMLGEIE